MTDTTIEVRSDRKPACLVEPSRQWGFLAIIAGLVLVSWAVTIRLCSQPACCTTISMPGGWSTSIMWLRADSTWLAKFGSFLVMWIVMMVAMMLPSLTPVLLDYRRALTESNLAEPALRPILVASGYFFVWTIFGVVLYPIGALTVTAIMRADAISRAMPLTGAFILVLAGMNQFAPWKSRQLACCRALSAADGAWRCGLRLGRHCVVSCFGLMLVLIALGVMDLTTMVVVTVAITAERLARNPARIARWTGAIMLIAGICRAL
jgi:predicted metal-binding membrane protein